MSTQFDIRDLVVRVRAGDLDAFAIILKRYTPQLMGLARQKMKGIAPRGADGEDFVQSAMWRLYKALKEGKEIEGHEHLWNLLADILDKCIKSWLKAQKRFKRGEGKVRGDSATGGTGSDGSPVPGFDQLAARTAEPPQLAIAKEALANVLERLDETMRKIAFLLLAGHSIEEVVQATGIPRRTIERKKEAIMSLFEEIRNNQ